MAAVPGCPGTVLVARRDGSVVALRERDGGLLRGCPLGGTLVDLVADRRGVGYAVTASGMLHCLGPDGSLRWNRRFQSGPGHLNPTVEVLPDGRIAVKTSLGDYVLYSPTGEVRDRIDSPTTEILAFAEDGSYTGGGNLGPDSFICKKNRDGRLLWEFSDHDDNGGYGRPVSGPGGTTYALSAHGKLVALGPDGREKWSRWGLGRGFAGYDAPLTVAPDGTLFVRFGQDDATVALAADGTLLWKRALEGDQPDLHRCGPRVGGDGQVYLGTPSGILYRLTSCGAEVLHRDRSGSWDQTPRVTRRGTILVRTEGTYVTHGNQGTIRVFPSKSAEDPRPASRPQIRRSAEGVSVNGVWLPRRGSAAGSSREVPREHRTRIAARPKSLS